MDTIKQNTDLSPEELEVLIQKQISEDDEDFNSTEQELLQARPFAEVFPDLAESIRRTRGRPALENPRQQISIRLDPDVIEKFKATGKGWQSRMNDILRKAVIE
jgi:uncharacterized protein (DUF4415 family)